MLRALTYMAIVTMDLGQIERAAAYLAAVMPLIPVAASSDGLATVFATYATLGVRRARFECGARLFGAATRCWNVTGTQWMLPESRRFSAVMTAVTIALGEQRVQELIAIGIGMDMRTSLADLALVLEDPDPISIEKMAGRFPMANVPLTTAIPAALGMLTARERDVLRLIGQGLADCQIAESLTISHLTARTHVRNVLRQLEYSTRAAAATWAARCGIT